MPKLGRLAQNFAKNKDAQKFLTDTLNNPNPNGRSIPAKVASLTQNVMADKTNYETPEGRDFALHFQILKLINLGAMLLKLQI